MKVLIAYDGSSCADDALDDLQRAGLPNDVEAVVLAVADMWFLPNGEPMPLVPPYLSAGTVEARATAAAMMEAARARAESACERLRAIFPTWQVTAKAVADSPAWAIVLEAESWGADLVVVGSHGHSSLNRWILGSVSQTVLTQATCSVRIGRGRPTAPKRPLRILVGVDGSAEAEAAVHDVSERVWPHGTDIRLMTVLEPSLFEAMNRASPATTPSSAPGPEKREGKNVEGGISSLLDSYLAIFDQKPPHLYVAPMLVAGDPKHALIEEAERWGADCIFIGARGLSAWQRLLLGSVSTAVATRAHCPVEVVRAAPPRN
jgi:nucleotide-binding universal stress UspA family protein